MFWYRAGRFVEAVGGALWAALREMLKMGFALALGIALGLVFAAGLTLLGFPAELAVIFGSAGGVLFGVSFLIEFERRIW